MHKLIMTLFLLIPDFQMVHPRNMWPSNGELHDEKLKRRVNEKKKANQKEKKEKKRKRKIHTPQ